MHDLRRSDKVYWIDIRSRIPVGFCYSQWFPLRPRKAAKMGDEKIETVTDLRVIAEGYAREWESWAAAIRNHPEVIVFGRPGDADFDTALDAAIALDEGGVESELDELFACDFED